MLWYSLRLARLTNAPADYLGAYEFASSLGPIADELLAKFDREQPFTHLLYVECEDVAKAMYQYMLKHCDMPNSLIDLEGYYETE